MWARPARTPSGLAGLRNDRFSCHLRRGRRTTSPPDAAGRVRQRPRDQRAIKPKTIAMNDPARSRAQFDGLQALVVEDETIVAFLIEDMLTELGCSAVWLANTVSAALAILADRRPDVA